MTVMVGTEAPDFRAEVYHHGKVGEIRLSYYRGRWVVLLFYPADFTCV